MSARLFQCLSSGEASGQKEAGSGAEGTLDPAAGERGHRRRSRSLVAAFLTLFRSGSSPPEKGVPAPQSAAQPAPAPDQTRRRPQSAGSGRPASSRMRLKRDRCPKCHGVLPVTSSGPELPPVLVMPGQVRQHRREYKEDSGCIMTEPRAPACQGSEKSGRADSSGREDSGNFSLSGSTSNYRAAPLPPQLPGLYSSRCLEFTTCVPRIPNRDAPVSNCVPIRG